MTENELRALKLVQKLRKEHPGHSDRWYAMWLERAAHYLEHDGNMTSAPPFPEE